MRKEWIRLIEVANAEREALQLRLPEPEVRSTLVHRCEDVHSHAGPEYGKCRIALAKQVLFHLPELKSSRVETDLQNSA